MKQENDICRILSAWGKWAREGAGDSLGYGEPMVAIMRGAPCVDADDLVGVKRYDDANFISDDNALVIDRIGTVLCKMHPVDGECLRLKYERGLSSKAIAQGYLSELRGKKVSEHTARQYVARGIGFVDGYLVNL